MKDVLGLIRNAERAQVEGNRRKAIRLLEAALRVLRSPSQLLPDWVQVGESVSSGKGSDRLVYTIVEVNRKERGWSFVGENMDLGGREHRMSFRQGSGKRSWRRHIG